MPKLTRLWAALEAPLAEHIESSLDKDVSSKILPSEEFELEALQEFLLLFRHMGSGSDYASWVSCGPALSYQTI